MSLTLGTGPLAPHRTGRFDGGTTLADHPVYVEPVERRVRGWLGGRPVVDSRATRMLHESGALPQWWFPREDVNLLEPTDRTEDDVKGRLRRYDLHLGDRVVRDAAYDVVEPADGLPDLSGLVAVNFGAVDRWQEEEDEVIGHPRDPYHRVDTRRSAARVTVSVGGTVVAETRRPVKLFETGLPVRWYVPREDVDQRYLAPSLTRTICPYKGTASYHSVGVGATLVEDGAWYYPEPLGEALQARDHLSFDGDGVEVRVQE